MSEIGLPGTFEETMTRVQETLHSGGLGVSRTFDLLDALEVLPPSCHCPHHGTERCSCRYAILLVHGRDRAPGSLLAVALHHRDRMTWVSIREPRTVDPRLRAGIELMLQGLQRGSAAEDGA